MRLVAESIMDFNFGVRVNQLSDTQNQFIVHQHFEESMHGKHIRKPNDSKLIDGRVLRDRELERVLQTFSSIFLSCYRFWGQLE